MTGHQPPLPYTIDPRFTRLLVRQRDIQVAHMGGDPLGLESEAKQRFLRDMAYALIVEVTEAIDETHWKPWAKMPEGADVVKNHERYAGELADAFIFLMNLMLAGGVTMGELAQRVDTKQTKNIQRQLDGYDGMTTKCPRCKRGYDDTGVKCFPGSDPGYAWCEETRTHVDQTGKVLP